MIPCIQTLAHLQAIFHWEPYVDIKDIDDILLLGEERTYELVDNMFKSLRECYTSCGGCHRKVLDIISEIMMEK